MTRPGNVDLRTEEIPGGGTAKRKRVATVESALTNVDVVSQLAVFLEAKELCQVKATCKALGATNDGASGLSMADEAARRVYEGASDEERRPCCRGTTVRPGSCFTISPADAAIEADLRPARWHLHWMISGRGQGICAREENQWWGEFEPSNLWQSYHVGGQALGNVHELEV
ncbi:hypothetical protein THAOC_36189 [Thalassiosira oceanica]|uniref:F-box domain-containing protein n=1 Tax=Thalassiosira oceanica TaxID=159749 RepID=K0R8V3_THAOC|nr:hypothetical protein THAOC_36189 [Thalassiosira oceanica]|eukprot:EJK45206.1 hypothetical protein THAOC_36189 [Thalassiosira oceanica]